MCRSVEIAPAALIRALGGALLAALIALAPGSAMAQIARDVCPVRAAYSMEDHRQLAAANAIRDAQPNAPHEPTEVEKRLYFISAAEAANDDAAYRAHEAGVEAVKAAALKKRPLAKAWASFAHVEVDASGNVTKAKGLLGPSPFRKSKKAPENAVLASIVTSIGQPGTGPLTQLTAVGGAQSDESRAEGEWATSTQTLPEGVECPHCLLYVRFDKENEQVVEVMNELVTVTNDLYQRPVFDRTLARALVRERYGSTTSGDAPMMALRDPYGKGRLVWGVFVSIRCATDIGIRSPLTSYGMDPRSYAIVGIFSNMLAVGDTLPRSHHSDPRWQGVPGWQRQPTYLYGPNGPPVWRRTAK